MASFPPKCSYCEINDPAEGPLPAAYEKYNPVAEIDSNYFCRGHLHEMITEGEVIYCITDSQFVKKGKETPGKIYSYDSGVILANWLHTAQLPNAIQPPELKLN